MSVPKPFRILLYYNYVSIEHPEEYAAQHLAFCQELGVRGRILIAHEGINGTISGTIEQTEHYMRMMKADSRFSAMEFKIDEADGHVFKKLHVRPKKELVTFRVEDAVDPNEITGNHLSPEEFFQAMQQEDVLILDGRTDYEYDLGHFRHAIRPDVRSFREFPQWIRTHLANYKDKKILTYCTGGIRCEKLSGFLLKEGFQDVSQLHGGIVSYGQDPNVEGRLFDGRCYVFDERISIPINRAEEYTIVSTCLHCGTSCDRYVNCANLDCHRQHFCCESCERERRRSCSKECEQAPAHRHEFGYSA